MESKYVFDDILALLGRGVRAPVCAPKRHTKHLKKNVIFSFFVIFKHTVCLVGAHTVPALFVKERYFMCL